MHSLRVELPCPDAATALAVRDAVAVESQDGPGGARIELAAEGASVLLRVEAADPGNLKAALHGALRLADMALRALSP